MFTYILVDNQGTILDSKVVKYDVPKDLKWYKVKNTQDNILKYTYNNNTLIPINQEILILNKFIKTLCFSKITIDFPEWKQTNLLRELTILKTKGGLTGKETLRKSQIEKCFEWIDKVRAFSNELEIQELTENEVLNADWPTR